MTDPPAHLVVYLWLIGSICLIAILAWIFDAPEEMVMATLVVGLLAALVEVLNNGEE
jgi:hypothetical protein